MREANYFKQLDSQRGAAALLMAFLIMAVLLIIVATISYLIISQVRSSSQLDRSVAAYYAAEAGAEQCFYQFRKGSGSCRNVGGVINGVVGGASYTATTTSASCIRSRGVFQDTARKVEIWWGGIPCP